MTYNPAIHHRRSIRLKGYDYTQCGAYFVTIVTQGRKCLFGRVVDGDMQLNDAGYMIARWWAELANKFPHVIPDAAIVMPNHFHSIIVITDGPSTPMVPGRMASGRMASGRMASGRTYVSAPVRPDVFIPISARMRACRKLCNGSKR